MTATATNAAPPRARPSVARTLLAIHLLGRAGDLGPRLGLGRTLPPVRLVHHHRIVQQLLVDARRDLPPDRFRTCRPLRRRDYELCKLAIVRRLSLKTA